MNIRKILNKFESIYVSSGDTVIRQGQLGDSCYFIKEGLAGVYQSESERSPSVLVAELGVGRCFGEDALVHETVRNATITMHSNGVLMRLDKQDFFLLLKSPAINCLNLAEAKNTVIDSACWLDVRTQDEFEKGHYPGAVNMPLNLLKLKSRMLEKNKHYLVYCNSGRRSEAATYLLGQDGFKASLLTGGIASYSAEEQKHFEEAAV